MKRLAVLAVLAACDSSSAKLSPDAALDAPVHTGPCGSRAGARGLSMRSVMAGGLARTYLVYLPPGTPTDRMPLVLVHHGYTMSGQKMFDITEYKALADAEHIAVAFPDGQGGADAFAAPWNVGVNVCPSGSGSSQPPIASGDDFAFIDAIKADIAADQCIDEQHVFATGFSMGGYFSHHLGCMRPDIRSVAPHSGGTHELSGCINAKRPIIMFHGKSDSLIRPGCNDPASPPVGVQPAATAWAARNGCGTTTTSRTVQGGTCVRYDGCPVGGQVELCTFDSMGHCWAGGPSSAGVYACPAYESATQLQWQFWRTYAWD